MTAPFLDLLAAADASRVRQSPVGRASTRTTPEVDRRNLLMQLLERAGATNAAQTMRMLGRTSQNAFGWMQTPEGGLMMQRMADPATDIAATIPEAAQSVRQGHPLRAAGQMALAALPFVPGAAGRVLQPTRSFDEVRHGEPVRLIAYHGTASSDAIRQGGFQVPDVERNPLSPRVAKKFTTRSERDAQGFLGAGTYFTDSRNIARGYGTPLVVEVGLQRPYVLPAGTSIDDLRRLDLDAIRAEGYDGIVVKGGKYGLTGESYRQGVVFDPAAARVLDRAPRPTALQRGALVRNPTTGEVGEVRGVRRLEEWQREYHPGNPTALVEVRWRGQRGVSRPRTDGNVTDVSVEVVGAQTP